MHGKKTGRVLLLALALTALCACGGKTDAAMQRALDLRTAIQAAGGCAFAAEVTADYGGQVYCFMMDCTYEAGAGAAFTLREPQTLAGIRAEVSSDGASVSYDDTMVGFASMAGGRLAPMTLPYLLGSGWYEGYLSAAGEEDTWTRVTCLLGYGEEELRLDTWLDEAGLPAHSEISYGGQTLLTAEIGNFSLERGRNDENTQKNMGRGVSG